MLTHSYAGRDVGVNEEGFLADAAQWNTEVAEAIAAETGIALTPTHWKVITFCREDYARQGASPGLRRIAQTTGVDMKTLYQLFPKGPGKLAAKIAGVPKPKSCL